MDPTSSWLQPSVSNEQEGSSENITIDATYYGFVPIRICLTSTMESMKDEFFRSCIETILSKPSLHFNKLLQEKKIGASVRLKNLSIKLIITPYILTIFYVDEDRTSIFARYLIENVSYHHFEESNRTKFVAIIGSNDGKTDFNVIKIESLDMITMIFDFGNKIDSTEIIRRDIQTRMKSIQDFKLERGMSYFYHGLLPEKKWNDLLKRHGDFLFRESRRENTKGVILTSNNMGVIESCIQDFNDQQMYKILEEIETNPSNFKLYLKPISVACFPLNL